MKLRLSLFTIMLMVGVNAQDLTQNYRKLILNSPNDVSLFQNNSTNGIWASGMIAGDRWAVFEDATASKEYLTIKSGGFVGIGTTSPKERFQIGNAFSFHDGGDDVLAIRSSYADFGQSGWNYLETGKSAFAIAGTEHIYFRIASGNGKSYGDPLSWIDAMLISTNGNVGIGTNTPDSKLAVNGNIHAKEVKVDLVGWSDYVFNDEYDLPTIEEVERHIKEKGHLINIPSANEVEKNGVQLGEMNKLLLEKIEELTLYTIQQQKELKAQKEKNKSLGERLLKVEKLLKIDDESKQKTKQQQQQK